MILEIPKKIKQKIIFLNKSQLFKIKNFQSFDDQLINFLSDISNKIIYDKNCKKYPDLISFAFWSRKKSLINYKNKIDLNNLFGRGLSFHISPSNVALNFLYSFSFSLLAGNSNIVRLPTKKFKEIDIFFKILNKLNKKKYREIFESNIFIRYDQNDEINEYFSSICNTRLVWGGDKTVQKFKRYETMPTCLDLTFPDRYSISLINASKLKNLKNNEFKDLIIKFYNDTYLYDQMACNSPHLIIWQKPDSYIINKFWKNLKQYLKNNYNLNHYISISKLTKLQLELAENKNIKGVINHENVIVRINLRKLENNFSDKKVGYGFFYELQNISVEKFLKQTNKKIQTVTYYGLNKNQIKKLLQKNIPKGIDRFVPIGQSGLMNFTWDGFDMIKSLSRKIDII